MMNEHELNRRLDHIERQLDNLTDLLRVVITLGENMALNLDALTTSVNNLGAAVDKLLAAEAAGSAADQAQIDTIAPQLDAITAKITAALPANP